MINRVDENPIYNGTYLRSGNRAKKVDEGSPAFFLENGDTGVIWERSSGGEEKDAKKSDKKEKRPVLEREEPAYRSRVRTKKREEETKEIKEAPEESLLTRFSVFIKDLFKRFMNAVWYGDEGNGAAEENAASSRSGIKEWKAAQALLREDEDTDFVLPGSEGRAARNTSVTTYYDKRGRMIQGGGTENDRIVNAEDENADYKSVRYGIYKKRV